MQGERAGSQTHRAGQKRRLDGIATILATTAVRDPTLLALLSEDAVITDAARLVKRDMLRTAGIERPSHTCGLVYCGYSSSPWLKLSSRPEASLPITPGSSRTQASSRTKAAISPPEST